MIDGKGTILRGGGANIRGGGAHFIGGGAHFGGGGLSPPSPLTLSPAYNHTEKETSHNAVAVMYKC